MPESCRFLTSSLLLLIACSLPGAAARAGDSEGQFAVRGAGLISCEMFVEARASQGNAYFVVAGWVDGYITGMNQYAPDTYDVLSFEGTELLMIIVDRHCKENPTDPVFGVLNSLLQELWSDRLTERSEKLEFAVGEREGRHYAEFIKRMQQKLRDQGLFEGNANGELTPATIEAISRYQASIGFEATGFPDQMTLWRLLRSPD